MKKKDLIIIGKKSFIGSNIYKFLKKRKKILILSLKEFFLLSNKEIAKYDYVCNCTVNKNNVKKNYKSNLDYDLKIAKKIKTVNINFIFLSSRKVYKPRPFLNEFSKLKPIDKDAQNKIKTENKLRKIFKSKLLILRISNVVGLKTKKNLRNVHKTFFDNYLDIVKINKTVIFYNQFKDFITINQLSKIFLLIISKNLTGIFNVSLGKKIYIREIISWLNKHNKNKKNFIYINQNKNKFVKESFCLDNSKLTKNIKYRPTKKELKIFCLKLSKKIH